MNYITYQMEKAMEFRSIWKGEDGKTALMDYLATYDFSVERPWTWTDFMDDKVKKLWPSMTFQERMGEFIQAAKLADELGSNNYL